MSDKSKTILITGSSGMIGSAAVEGFLNAGYRVIGIDIKDCGKSAENYRHYTVDLGDSCAVESIIKENCIDRVIHLAGLAHSVDGKEYTWDDYKHLNVDCSVNVLEASKNIPVLFISTVDVYGFTDSPVTPETKANPVSYYAKSKLMAENECIKHPCHSIFRFSPVYTDDIKRDIQKRYYLRCPSVAYRIGKGTEYEILNIKNAVRAMVEWCAENPCNDIRIIKDPVRMNTADYIKAEKNEGRANFVLYLPEWVVKAGYKLLRAVTGENKYTYLLNKAVCPLRSEDKQDG
ncbi:MAG: NAD(P)-dependent oxidoreductase [Clostridia bacterium]|nr:NAD(P)-dependent oxidoreductase [Clostridia bacterium]